jgi:hypothetical protein
MLAAMDDQATPTDQTTQTDPSAEPERPEVIALGQQQQDGGAPDEFVEQPAKLLRIASMIRELLEEVRQAEMDEPGRARLKAIYERSIEELKGILSDELQRELTELTMPFDGTPSESEIRVAQAQLVGWLEGLFHGIQAALWAQHMQARAQLEEMRRRGLPPGAMPPQDMPGSGPSGQYL